MNPRLPAAVDPLAPGPAPVRKPPEGRPVTARGGFKASLPQRAARAAPGSPFWQKHSGRPRADHRPQAMDPPQGSSLSGPNPEAGTRARHTKGRP